MKIKAKILSSVILLLLFSIVLFGTISTIIVKSNLEKEVEGSIKVQAAFLSDNLVDLNKNSEILETAMLKGYDQSIQEHLEIVMSLIQKYYNDFQAGKYESEEVAKNAAKEMIGSLRYGQSGYFWMDDQDYTLLVLPTAPEKVGMNRYDVQDKEGYHMMRNIIGKAITDGSTFTDYWWNKIGSEDLFPKRGFSMYFKEWGWIPGTGNYIDEISTQVEANKALLEDRFRENLKKSEVNGLAFVFDNDAKIIYNSNKSVENKTIGEVFADDTLLSKLNEEGMVDFEVGGKEYLAYVMKNAEAENNLIIAKEKDVVFKGVRDLTYIMLGLLLAFIVMGVFISIYLAGKIATPIKKLTNAGNKIADGKLDEEIPSFKTKDEIQDLSTTMNLLVGAIKYHVNKDKK